MLRTGGCSPPRLRTYPQKYIFLYKKKKLEWFNIIEVKIRVKYVLEKIRKLSKYSCMYLTPGMNDRSIEEMDGQKSERTDFVIHS